MRCDAMDVECYCILYRAVHQSKREKWAPSQKIGETYSTYIRYLWRYRVCIWWSDDVGRQYWVSHVITYRYDPIKNDTHLLQYVVYCNWVPFLRNRNLLFPNQLQSMMWCEFLCVVVDTDVGEMLYRIIYCTSICWLGTVFYIGSMCGCVGVGVSAGRDACLCAFSCRVVSCRVVS